MTQEPQREVEVQGRAGEPVALPVDNDGATPCTWTLDLPAGVEAAGTTTPSRLRPAPGPAGRPAASCSSAPTSPGATC